MMKKLFFLSLIVCLTAVCIAQNQHNLLVVVPTNASALRAELSGKHWLVYANPLLQAGKESPVKAAKFGALYQKKLAEGISLKLGGTALAQQGKNLYGSELMLDWLTPSKRWYVRLNADWLLPANVRNIRAITSFAPIANHPRFRLLWQTAWNSKQGWSHSPALVYKFGL